MFVFTEKRIFMTLTLPTPLSRIQFLHLLTGKKFLKRMQGIGKLKLADVFLWFGILLKIMYKPFLDLDAIWLIFLE